RRAVAGSRQGTSGLRIDLSSARDSRDGMPVNPGRVDGDSVITINGMEVRVEDAINAGLIDARMIGGRSAPREAESDFIAQDDAEDNGNENEEEERPRAASTSAEPIDPGAEAVLNHALMDANDEALGLASEFLESGGVMTDESIAALATRLEIEPAQAQ